MKRIRLISIFLCAPLFLFSGCGADEPVIKVGVSAPFTGDQASVGLTILNGAKLAVEEANASGRLAPSNPSHSRAHPAAFGA